MAHSYDVVIRPARESNCHSDQQYQSGCSLDQLNELVHLKLVTIRQAKLSVFSVSGFDQHIHTHTYLHTYMCTYTYKRTYMYIHTYDIILMHLHIHMYMYVRAYRHWYCNWVSCIHVLTAHSLNNNVPLTKA